MYNIFFFKVFIPHLVILNIICFDIESELVTRGDIEYIFDLCYQMIERITDVKLKTCSTHEQMLQ
jgi:hypothetical protein